MNEHMVALTTPDSNVSEPAAHVNDILISPFERSARESVKYLESVASQDEINTFFGLAAREAETDMLEADFAMPALGEQDRPVSKKILHGLGRVATSPVRGVSWVNAHANAAYVNVLGKTPGFKSKEEIIEDQRLRNEKYTVREGDGALTKMRKAIGRNAIKAAAWTPVAFMGLIGANMLARPLGHAVEEIPFVNMPEVHLAVATDLYVGGHTQGDPINSGFIDSVKAAGLYNDNNRNVPIYWSANMAPISGDGMPMTASDAEGAQKIVDAVNDAGGKPVRIFSFSQGTEASLRAANQLAAQNGGRVPDNVTIILEGTPSGDLGIGKNSLVGTVNPILGAMGIETNQPIPPGAHVIVRTDIADVFGNGGNQGGLKLGEMAMGPGHRVVGPDNGVLISRYEKDGVTYEIYGDKDGINDPFLRVLKDQGVPITPQAEALAEAAVPFTMPGQPIQYGNADNVASKLGPAIDSYTGNSGAATRAVDAITADPVVKKDLQNFLGLEQLPDQANSLAQHPEQAPVVIPQIMNEVTGAANSGLSYLQDPNKGVDMANKGLQANGIPGLIPHFQAPVQQPPAANLVPQGNADVINQMNVPFTQIPTSTQNNLGTLMPGIKALETAGQR